jgi:outer membrane receptor for ferrienterochelin and colicin
MLLAHGETATIKSDANGDGFNDSPVMNQINFMNSWKYQGSKGFESRFGFKVINESRTGGQLTFNRNQEINTSNGYGITLDTRRYEGYLKMGYVFANRPGTSVGFINSAYHHDQGSVFGLNRYKGLHESYSSTLLFQSFIGNTFHGFTAGVSYLFDSYEESLNDSIFNRIEAVPGAFFQYTYQPGEKMTLMAGLRGDYHNLFSFMLTPRLHFRYNLTKGLTLRASIGKGYRTANVIAENSALLASSRSIRVIESPEQEIAWNYGLNLSHRIEINGREMLFSAEYYRTDFQNQVIVDLEHDISLIRIYNLDGKSYSNAYQFDFSYEPVRGLDLKLGYRITDVKTTIDDMLIEKPLVNRHKGLINTSYITRLKKWQFDLTLHINGMGRLASTSALPQEYQRNKTFPTYTILNGQLTKRFKYLDLYLGSENITNFKQEEPILASADPFGPYFDASMVWGPIRGRMFYMGIRIDIK